MDGRHRTAGSAAALLLAGCAVVGAPARTAVAEPVAASERHETSFASALPAQEDADTVRDTFTSTHGSRPYRLFVPSAERPALVVMLHGCTQTADEFAAGTRADAAGEAAGALVLYPEQPRTAQPQGCWAWYEPGNQERGSGEVALLAGMIEAITAEYGADRNRIYVAGISAGGAMAQVLSAAYPDLVAAQALHSAVPYRSAHDMAGAFEVVQQGAPEPEALTDYVLEAMGERARAVPTLIIHGAEDPGVRPINAEHIEAQWAGVARRLAPNELLVRRVMVPGLGHAWSGGSAEGTFTDPSTMDATARVFDFFFGSGE